MQHVLVTLKTVWGFRIKWTSNGTCGAIAYCHDHHYWQPC